MKVSSDGTAPARPEPEERTVPFDRFRSQVEQLTVARRQVTVLRDTVVALEGGLRDMLGLRARVQHALRLVHEGRTDAARAELVRVLEAWPSS